MHEAERDPVAPLFDREAQVTPVLFGQRGHGHHDVGHIHALAVGQRAADLDDRVDPRLADRLHPQHHLAIVQQQPGARHQRGIDFGMGQVDAARVAGRLVAVEDEGRALFQDRQTLFERADAQFRPLQIGQYGGWPMKFIFKFTDNSDARGMILRRAMAHIDAEGVGSGDKQRADHLRAVARGAKGRENTHLARTGR